MNKFIKLKVSFISAICLLIVPSFYSSVSEAADSDVVDEVLVTARKREESLLDIPESVQAIGGADIDRQNIKSLEDVGFLTCQPELMDLLMFLLEDWGHLATHKE